MKPWAERFYNSDAWRSCRDSFLKSKGYLCERCSTPDDPVTAKIAHHKTYLTKQNINDPYIALSWDSLSCLNPFWREETETREDIATWIGGFEFPVPDGLELYDGWEIGYRQPSLIVNVYNSGDVKSGIRIEFRAIGAVTNPVLLNVDTREFIKLNISLVAGDVLTVSTGYGEKAVKLNRGGVITDAFRYLDVDSSYLQIAVGDNLFRYSADANAENLEVSIYHNNLYLGV